jgi:hypothetical protein
MALSPAGRRDACGCLPCDDISRTPIPLLLAQLITVAAATPPQLQLSWGKVHGTSLGLGAVEQYLGLPYAHAPTGPRRWQPPVDWDQPFPDPQGLDARAFGPACPQADDPTGIIVPQLWNLSHVRA